MIKRFILLLLMVIVSLSLINVTAFADDPTDSSNTTVTEEQGKGPKDKEGKWLANKARIAEKKAEIAARKEAFFALKEKTKQDIGQLKALIKEQKALIKEQIQLINELSPHERKKLKAEIKTLWEEVRETHKCIWEIRRSSVEQAHEILGKVEVIEKDLSEEELQNIEGLVSQL